MVSCGLVGKQEEDVHERAGASELDAAQGAGLLINLLSPTAGSGVGVRCPAPGSELQRRTTHRSRYRNICPEG
ncbi:unnamed protein product [Arctogadus glacialis]